MTKQKKPTDRKRQPVSGWAALLLIAALAACGRGDEGPGGVTRSEQKALDDAAEMVEQKQLNPSAIPPAPAAQPTASPTSAGSESN